MRRCFSLLPIGWLVLLLVLPGVLWVFGARQPELENRPTTPIPSLNRESLRADATFRQLDQAILDRLPLRKTALDVRGRLSVDLFRDSTHPDVALGRQGWLYYLPELRTCGGDGVPAADPADAVEWVARALTTSGRRAAIIVAGSKIVTATTWRPKLDPERLACVEALERRVQERLAATPGGSRLQSKLERIEASGRPTFLQSNTHWNATGREQFIRAVLDRIRPGLAEDVGVHRGRIVERDGDLGAFLGIPRVDHDPEIDAQRAPTRPIRPGSVLIVGDSQMGGAFLAPLADGQTLLQRVLPGQQTCDWPSLANGVCDDGIRQAKTVVIEVVARNLSTFVDACWRPVALASEGLRGSRGRWTVGDDGPSRSITLGEDPVPLAADPAGHDTAKIPRILRIPIRRLPGAPTPVRLALANPGASPCSLLERDAAQGAFLVTVPAGRSVTDLGIVASGPAGTVLGAPEELRLTGPPTR